MKLRILLQALLPTIFFNFRYLPFKQAMKLPIWLYKPHFISLKGSVKIDTGEVYPGMIRLGFLTATTYPDNGFTWNNEGQITFKGKCMIGNNTFIVTGKQGKIVFGDDFRATASLKIVSCIGITFGKSIRFGWEVIVMDTNFHPLYDIEKKHFKKAFGKIDIGDYNWFSTQCYIMHSVTTPERCIFGARSMVTHSRKYESYCIHGGSPIGVLSRNVMRDLDKKLDYSEIDE